MSFAVLTTDCFEHVVRRLPLSDKLALLLTNRFARRSTQPHIQHHKRLIICVLRNWKIRVLPWASSRTRRQIEDASSQICRQYDKRAGPWLPVLLTLQQLQICHRDSPPNLIEAMIVLRIRRALRRSGLADLEAQTFLHGQFQYGLFWQYIFTKQHELRPQLTVFLHDLLLPQVEYALSTYSVLPQQRIVNSRTSHEVMLVLRGN